MPSLETATERGGLLPTGRGRRWLLLLLSPLLSRPTIFSRGWVGSVTTVYKWRGAFTKLSLPTGTASAGSWLGMVPISAASSTSCGMAWFSMVARRHGGHRGDRLRVLARGLEDRRTRSTTAPVVSRAHERRAAVAGLTLRFTPSIETWTISLGMNVGASVRLPIRSSTCSLAGPE